jgi:hypothetical protein
MVHGKNLPDLELWKNMKQSGKFAEKKLNRKYISK